MTDVEGNVERAHRAGFAVLGHFELPRRAWWEHYLTPLAYRIRELRPLSHGDPELARVLDEQEAEIAICRDHLGSFGYVFYLLRRRDG